MRTAAILLAAGRSRRFGNEDKLLANFRGQPLIAHAVQPLRDFKPDHLVAVMSNKNILPKLDGFECISVESQASSQSISLHAGIEHALNLGVDRAIIALADMPFVNVQLIKKLQESCTDDRGSATTDGKKSSPPACFPRSVFDALLKLQGDQGAREIIQRMPLDALVAVNGLQLTDIDSKDDLMRHG